MELQMMPMLLHFKPMELRQHFKQWVALQWNFQLSKNFIRI
jgi:hypothetical protein